MKGGVQEEKIMERNNGGENRRFNFQNSAMEKYPETRKTEQQPKFRWTF